MTITEALKKTAKQASSMMANLANDPIQLLTEQHREVEQLFEEFERLGPQAYRSREKIAREIINRIRLHARIEEKIFYPSVRDINEDLVLEAYEEHEVAKQLMKKIEKTDPKDETYIPRVSVLKDVIKHHVNEEENELFPQIRAELSEDDLEKLFAKMEKKVSQMS